ncbi:MAG: DUF4013 domain-containing protein [Dehalococcoidales bacterium]|nr:DUF4013 domain-containing protein [Dehalococcoidales bacterium]
MILNIKKAFTNPVRDKAWLTKLFIGGLISSITIIGAIIVNGYLMLYLASLLKSDDHNLPGWTDIGIILKISLKLLVVYIAYFSPLIVFQFIVDRYFPLNETAIATSLRAGMIINLPLLMFIKFFLNVAYVEFAQNNFKISAALNIREVFNLIKINIRGYKVVYLCDVILGIISFIPIFYISEISEVYIIAHSFLIGIIFFYPYLTINNMLAMVFRKRMGNGVGPS